MTRKASKAHTYQVRVMFDSERRISSKRLEAAIVRVLNHATESDIEGAEVLDSRISYITAEVVGGEAIRLSEAYAFAQTISRMTIEGEIDDNGDEYSPDGNDEEIDALYELIRDARAITGFSREVAE